MAHCSKCARAFLTEWPLVCQLVDCPQASVNKERRRHEAEMNETLGRSLDAKSTQQKKIVNDRN